MRQLPTKRDVGNLTRGTSTPWSYNFDTVFATNDIKISVYVLNFA